MTATFNLDQHIGKTPGFPKEGITFYDISPALENPIALKHIAEALINAVKNFQPDVIAAVDARGFLFSVPIALALNCGTIMIRKKGKLPGTLAEESYALEYGEATLAIQKDRSLHNKRVVIIDDLLATGGTVAASQRLLEQVGAKVVGLGVVIELTGLKAREKLKFPITALQTYEF